MKIETGRWINIAAFLLHAILFIIIICVPSNKEDPKGFVHDQKKIASQANTSVFLLRAQNITFRDSCTYWPYEGFNYGIKVNLKLAVATFTAITCIAHLFYAICFAKLKRDFLEHGTNIFRWIEYGLSAPIMLCILAILANVRDQMLLLVLFLLTSVQMIQGYYVEHALSNEDGKGAWKSLLPFLVGLLCLVVSWFVILYSWYGGLNQATDNAKKCDFANNSMGPTNPKNSQNFPSPTPSSTNYGNKSLKSPSKPPDIVHLIWVILFLFVSFGIVSFVQIVRRLSGYVSKEDNNKQFIKYEYTYISLSFISKAILILWCVFSIFLGKLEWLKTCPSISAKIDNNTKMPACLRELPFVVNNDKVN